MKKISRMLKNKKYFFGFSLIEILVVLGVGSIITISVGYVLLMTTSVRTQNETHLVKYELIARLRRLLSDKTSLTNTALASNFGGARNNLLAACLDTQIGCNPSEPLLFDINGVTTNYVPPVGLYPAPLALYGRDGTTTAVFNPTINNGHITDGGTSCNSPGVGACRWKLDISFEPDHSVGQYDLPPTNCNINNCPISATSITISATLSYIPTQNSKMLVTPEEIELDIPLESFTTAVKVSNSLTNGFRACGVNAYLAGYNLTAGELDCKCQNACLLPVAGNPNGLFVVKRCKIDTSYVPTVAGGLIKCIAD